MMTANCACDLYSSVDYTGPVMITQDGDGRPTCRNIFHILDSENFCRFSLREAKCSASVAPSMSSIIMYSLSSASINTHVLAIDERNQPAMINQLHKVIKKVTCHGRINALNSTNDCKWPHQLAK